MATRKPTFIVHGPCSVFWDSKDLGVTKQGVTIRPQLIWTPIGCDKSGGVPCDWIFCGCSIIVEAIFMDMTLLKTALGGVATKGYGGSRKPGGQNLSNGTAWTLPGTLINASTQNAAPLEIKDRDGTSIWKADLALPFEGPMSLQSNTELGIGLVFVVTPSDGTPDTLLTTIPA